MSVVIPPQNPRKTFPPPNKNELTAYSCINAPSRGLGVVNAINPNKIVQEIIQYPLVLHL